MASTTLEALPADPADPDRDAPAILGDVLLLNLDLENDLQGFDKLLRPAGYRVRASASLAQARQLVARVQPIAGLLHLGGPEAPAVTALEEILEANPSLRLIALVEPTDTARTQLAPLIKRDLIYDYHTLPLDLDRLLYALGHINGLVAVERAARATADAAARLPDTEMIGSSPGMAAITEAIAKVARARAPVMIRGESGTGKELVAHAIHRQSERAAAPFVAVNCAALPPSLIGSELFGHEKGAFTGAINRKTGRIEAAQGGTLFLDEIGDLPLELQGHFLRFLQEQTIDRIGGTAPIDVDVRVLAATHVDLGQAHADGRFREDLFYRLNVLTIDLPPLRARGNDVELLAQYYLDRFARELGRPFLGFRESAKRMIRAHPWPGNVRELISCVQRAAVMAEGKWVTAADLGLAPATVGDAGDSQPPPTLQEARAELEKRLIRGALERSGQTVQVAARELGVSRMTLYRLLERYDLNPDRAAAKSNTTNDPEDNVEL